MAGVHVYIYIYNILVNIYNWIQWWYIIYIEMLSFCDKHKHKQWCPNLICCIYQCNNIPLLKCIVLGLRAGTHTYSSYTVLNCYKYWLKGVYTYTCSCYVVCWRHPELCLHAWTWNSVVHLYWFDAWTGVHRHIEHILVSQRWIQDRLHLVDWPKYTTHKRFDD